MNAFLTITDTGFLAVKGFDAKKFLQGQLTCHLDEVTANKSSLAARCNLQGRVRAFFRISLFKEAADSFYLIELPLSMVDLLTKDLKQYAMFSPVEIQDLSSSFAALGFYGDKTLDFLNTLFGKTFNLSALECEMVNWQNEPLQICCLSAETPRFEVLGSKTAIASLQDKIPIDFEENTMNFWHQLDITAKIPTIYPETADEFLPHHLNLVELGAINFKKGCYLGQEIIARMHYKGKIKKGLYRFTMPKSEPMPKVGTALYTDSNLENDGGNIISICQERDKYHVLAIFNHDLIQKNVFLSPQNELELIKD